MIDLIFVILGIIIGMYFANDWKNQKMIEWSKNMELFVGLFVLILLGWLLYSRYYKLNIDSCIKIIILFLTINMTFHFCLYFDKYRKTK